MVTFIRDWAMLGGILLIGFLAGLVTWLAAQPQPELQCGNGYVTLTCPFTDPALNREYQGNPIYVYTGDSGAMVANTGS